MRLRWMRWSTPRTRREFDSIARCASSRKPISSAAESGSAAARNLSRRSCAVEAATASAKRARSGSISGSDRLRSSTFSSSRSATKAVPMAMPGETPIPVRLCSPLSVSPGVSSVLIELAFNEAGERLDRGFGIAAVGGQLDDGAGGGRQHHQPHDRAAGHRGAVLAHPDLGFELAGGLDKAGGGAGVQSALVADFRGAPCLGNGGRPALLAHLRAATRSWEATLMYLRPASWAPSTLFSSPSCWRRLASLISIGRLTPATTSTLPRSITEIARFDGVPPNMSVNSATPSPVSTWPIVRRMS